MNRIRELRLSHNMKQIDFARQLGISQGTLSSWENNKFEPDVASLLALSKIFSVSIDFLLGNDVNLNSNNYLLGRENKKEAPSPVPMLGKDAQKLLDMYDELSAENKDQVMRYVTSIYYVDRANKSAQYSGALAAYEGGTEQHTVSKETAEKVLRRLDDMEKNT